MTQARYYSSTASQTTLTGSINSSIGTCVVASASGFPSSFPYTLILERDTVNEEVVEVTAATGTTLTISRGVDGTSGKTHAVDATVDHGVSARDFTEPQQHIADDTKHVPAVGSSGQVLTVVSGVRAWAAPGSGIPLSTVTTKGDLIAATAGGAVSRVGVGTDGQALVADAASAAGLKFATPTTRIGHTWTISGAVAVASGDTNYVCPLFVPVPAGQVVSAAGYRARINSGTSATVKIQKNGVDLTGYTGLSVTTTPAGGSPTGSLADTDMLALIVTAVSGSPFNLSFTLYLDYAPRAV